jgi:uncharacterized protein YndB with AHSA1/START domain
MSQQSNGPDDARSLTAVEREGDRDLAVTRIFDAPPGTVYRAWSQSELFRRWWMPRSAAGVSLVSCDMDVRTGGGYRLEFRAEGPDTMAFHGKYLDVVPNERMVWTNDEGDDGAVTTVTFRDQDGRTLLTYHESYPSRDAREEALQGSAAGLPEQLDQLAELLATPAE